MNFPFSAEYFSLFNDKIQLIPEISQWDHTRLLRLIVGIRPYEAAFIILVSQLVLCAVLGVACAATRAPQKRHKNLKNTIHGPKESRTVKIQ